MFYSYEVYNVKKKYRAKKIIIIILIILMVIALSVFGAIQLIKNMSYKEYLLAQEKIKQEEEIKQKEIEEEKRKEQEKLKNVNPLTEEQMYKIEHIYSDEYGKRVFLTFDDGPTASVTPLILDVLKQEDVKATFFVLGNRAKANPELIKREFEEGHYIANHGYTHKYSTIYESPQTVIDEYNYAEECIKQALENPNYNSRLFRFPGGSNGGYYSNVKSQTKQELRQLGIVSLDWNCLSKDAEGANTKEELLQNVIDTASNKESVVILMHDASDKILTYEVLPEIIKYFKDNGYIFENIYDIL